MTSVLLLVLFAACAAAIRGVAIALRRPLSRGALVATIGLPLLFLLPGFFTATTPLPTDHALGFWPWHVFAGAPPRNANLNDLATQMAPWAKAVRSAYKNLELPLRDRWNGCGTPLAANGQSGAFSPFTFLGLLLPLARAATLAGALKLALALSGTWLWLRELELSDGAALFGATTFGFSMTMIPWLFFPHTAVICLWPWALFAAERLRDGRSSARAFVLLTAIFTVWPLCGHSESVALGSAFLAIWLVGRAVLGDRTGLSRLLPKIAAAGALALGLSAFALVPQALAIRASNRFAQAAHPFWSGSFSLLPRANFWKGGLLTPLFPRIFGDSVAAPMIAGAAGSFPEMALGAFGLVGWTLALSIFRPGSRRRRAEWVLVVLLVFGLGAAIDLWPFAEIAGSLPLLRLMFPLRFFSIVSLAGSALAAFELDRLAADVRGGARSWIFPAAVAVLLAGIASVAFPHFRNLHEASGGWTAERRAWIFAVAVLLAVAASCAVFGLRRPGAGELALALTILSTGALLWDGKRLYRFDSVAKLFPETPLVRFLQGRPRPFRVVGDGAVLFPNTNVFAGVEEVRTHDPAERRDYVEFLDANCGYDPRPYFKQLRDVNAPALEFLNVRYLVSVPGRTAPAPKWRPVYSGADGTVFENPAAFPRVFSADPASPIEVSRYREGTNRIALRARVGGDRPALAVASIVQDGGWTIRDERSRRLPVVPYRGLFLSAWLPPGEHDFVFEYSPPGFRAGCRVSFSALLLAIVLTALRARRSSVSARSQP